MHTYNALSQKPMVSEPPKRNTGKEFCFSFSLKSFESYKRSMTKHAKEGNGKVHSMPSTFSIVEVANVKFWSPGAFPLQISSAHA